MAEWFKAPDSKSGLGAILAWVQIPPLPPIKPIAQIFTFTSLAKHHPSSASFRCSSAYDRARRVGFGTFHPFGNARRRAFRSSHGAARRKKRGLLFVGTEIWITRVCGAAAMFVSGDHVAASSASLN